MRVSEVSGGQDRYTDPLSVYLSVRIVPSGYMDLITIFFRKGSVKQYTIVYMSRFTFALYSFERFRKITSSRNNCEVAWLENWLAYCPPLAQTPRPPPTPPAPLLYTVGWQRVSANYILNMCFGATKMATNAKKILCMFVCDKNMKNLTALIRTCVYFIRCHVHIL